MGAGTQRWWRDRDDPAGRLERECEEWRVGTRAQLAQAIIRAPARELRLLKPLLTAWTKLWMLLAGEPEEPQRPAPTSIPGGGITRKS